MGRSGALNWGYYYYKMVLKLDMQQLIEEAIPWMYSRTYNHNWLGSLLLKGLSNPNSSSEKLNLVRDEIGDEVVHAFVAAIANNTSLKSLEVNYVDSIRHWRLDDIVALLNPDSSALVELNLSNININEGYLW